MESSSNLISRELKYFRNGLLLYMQKDTEATLSQIDDYAKDGGPEEVRLLCSFYREHLPT